MPVLYPESDVLRSGAYEHVPVKIESSRSDDLSFAAGPRAPAMQEFQMAPGIPIPLPSKEAAERLESLSESWELMYAYLRRGYSMYGDEWLEGMKEYFPISSRVMRPVS